MPGKWDLEKLADVFVAAFARYDERGGARDHELSLPAFADLMRQTPKMAEPGQPVAYRVVQPNNEIVEVYWNAELKCWADYAEEAWELETALYSYAVAKLARAQQMLLAGFNAVEDCLGEAK